MTKRDGEIYLGDGAYASFDGWQIWLRAPRENGDHVIALEPFAFATLKKYAEKCWAPKRAATDTETAP